MLALFQDEDPIGTKGEFSDNIRNPRVRAGFFKLSTIYF